jgi:GT2 family glycosyltransferase
MDPLKKLLFQISEKNISVIIPTYKRKSNVNKIIENISSKCSIKGITIIIIDDDEDTKGTSIIYKDTLCLAEKRYHSVIELKNSSSIHGVASSRNVGIKKALKIKSDHIICMDDDAFPGTNCFERLLALQIKEPRFAVSAVAGGYTKFWRDFQKDSVKFYTALGVCYSFSAEAIRSVGYQDTNLIIKSDQEYVLRMWNVGFWSGAVMAPIIHKRFSEREDGKTLPRDKSPDSPWVKDSYYIVKKYPHLVKTTKHGSITTLFDYPKVKYTLDENYKLRKEIVR